MASIDSQNYSPLLEKRNFKDMLDSEETLGRHVEEDLITKIFSQTVQVSPSEEVPEPFVDQQDGGASATDRNGSEMGTPEIVIVTEDDEEHEEPLEFDKVPTDLSHFNQTIIDLDEDEDEEAVESPVELDSSSAAAAAITAAATECVEEIIGELEEQINNGHSHINTPSTASPVDDDDDDEENDDHHHQHKGITVDDDEQESEIRDFEEFERITEVSPEKEVVFLGKEDQEDVEDEEPFIAEEEEIERGEAVNELEQEQQDAKVEELLVRQEVDVVDCRTTSSSSSSSREMMMNLEQNLSLTMSNNTNKNLQQPQPEAQQQQHETLTQAMDCESDVCISLI